MKYVFSLSKCKTIRFIFYVLIFSIVLISIKALVIIVLIDYPAGFKEVFNTESKHFGSLISGASTIFSGVIVILGAIITVQSHQEYVELERTQELKSIISSLSAAFVELADLCKDMVSALEDNKSDDDREYCLSKFSLKMARTAIKNLRGDECERLYNVFSYYQIAINRFKKQFSNSKCYSGNATNMSKHKDEDEEKRKKRFVVDLISLMSIAEVYVDATIRGTATISIDTCRKQFRDNMIDHIKSSFEGDYVKKIKQDYDLEYHETKHKFEGYIGFLEENYFEKFKLKWRSSGR